MRYTITADWKTPNGWSDDEALTIAGLEALVQDKGDCVSWEVTDMTTGRQVGGDWLDSRTQAREAAERAIIEVLDRRVG